MYCCGILPRAFKFCVSSLALVLFSVARAADTFDSFVNKIMIFLRAMQLWCAQFASSLRFMRIL